MASAGSDSGEGEGPHSGTEEFMEVDGAVGGVGVGAVGIEKIGATAAAADKKIDQFLLIDSDSQIDLENFTNGYVGSASKIKRLTHIGTHCPSLRIDALKLALRIIKTTTLNISGYKRLTQELQTAISNQQVPIGEGGAAPADLPQLDQEWIDETTRVIETRLEKLKTELSVATTELTKAESHFKLAEHYLELEDYSTASGHMTRARGLCSSVRGGSSEVFLKIWLGLIRMEILMENWKNAASHLGKLHHAAFCDSFSMPAPLPSLNVVGIKVEAPSSSTMNLTPAIETLLNCIAGLIELGEKNYKSAANFFLGLNCSHFEPNEYLTMNNVAVYGSLCALASFDRVELQRKVLSNSSFKSFLEYEPEVAQALNAFNDSKFLNCFSLLNGMNDKLLLDPYMSPHVTSLYTRIRRTGMVQYCLPFQTAHLERMAHTFGTSTEALEVELMDLISKDEVHGRIDAQAQVLKSSERDQRNEVVAKAFKMGSEFEKRTKLLFLRVACLKNDVSVKPKEPTAKHRGGGKGKGKGKGRSKKASEDDDGEVSDEDEEDGLQDGPHGHSPAAAAVMN